MWVSCTQIDGWTGNCGECSFANVRVFRRKRTHQAANPNFAGARKFVVSIGSENSAAASAMPEPNFNTHRKAYNLRGTRTHTCTVCGTWLKHWRKFTNTRANTQVKCGRKGCREDADRGGHIQLQDGRSDNAWHIVPLCETCNGPEFWGQEFWLKKKYKDIARLPSAVKCP